MRSVAAIFRRELGAYFNSPMAYVVAIGFMLLNSSLWVLDFWTVDEVSLRGFFEWISWTACFLVPAITMRTWAEDKKGGTYELLLTFPMRSLSLVTGKYLAALTFFAFCLSGTLVLAGLLATLATPDLPPDWGAMAAGLLGIVLTGSFLIALGLFVSVLCRDQIEAFIVTLVIVLALRLLGFAPVAGQLDSILDGAGSFLRESVSFSTPLSRFLRGIVALGDVLFFAAWTAVFLVLNGAILESRMRPGSRLANAAGVALGIPAAVLLGSLLLDLAPRADLTADKVFTVTDAAEDVLRSVPEDKPVLIKLYFSPRDEMPTAMRTLERDVVERLDDFRRVAGPRLHVDVVHLHADDAVLRALEEARAAAVGGEKEEGDDERGKVESQLVEEGVVPFRVRAGGLTGTETKVVYAALTLTHGASKKEVLPQLVPGSMGALEQDVITRIYRLVNDKRPVVGILAPIQAVDIPPQQLQLLAQLGIPIDQVAREQDDYRFVQALLAQDEQYEVRRLRPSDDELPPGLDALVVIRPDGLSDRLRWDMARFLHGGGAIVMAVQTFDSGLQRDVQGVSIVLSRVETGVDALLSPYGLSVPQEMAMAEESFPVSYSTGPLGPVVTVDVRWIFRLDASNFDHETSLANGVGGFVLIESASPVVSDARKLGELKLELQPILRTGEKVWTREVPDFTMPSDVNDVRPAKGPLDLAALVRGQFPPPEGERPVGTNPDAALEPPSEAPAKPGNLFVLGTARPFHDEAIADPSGQVSWAGVLLKNAVDGLALGDALLRLRVHDARPRPIRDVSRSEMLVYEVLIVGLAPALFLLVAVLRFLARRRLRERPFAKQSAPAAASE